MLLHASMYILWNEIDNHAICCCLLNMSIFSLLFTKKSDFLLSVWKIHPKEVLFRDQIRCAQWRGMIHNPLICQNPPFPPDIPGHLTGFLLLKVGKLTLPGLLALAFDFRVKTPFSIASERISSFFHSACALCSWIIAPILLFSFLEHLRAFEKTC